MPGVHLETTSALHPLLREPAEVAVRYGLEHGAGPHAAVAEVHVKGSRPRRRWFVVGGRSRTRAFARRRDAVDFADRHGGAVEVRDVVAERWTTGRAYDGVPDIARVVPGVRYLVTLKIPLDRAGEPVGRYPRTWRYEAYRTAPPATFTDWCEELVHAAAHEGRHVWQFATGAPRSEIDAEQWACTVLERWRATVCETAQGQLALF
jgi:hypothetical protein